MPTQIDKRMTWIRLLTAHGNAYSERENTARESPVFDITDYEFVSEKYIPGELEFGNIFIRPFLSHSQYHKKLNSYYLRLESPQDFDTVDVYTWQNSSEKGYYSKGYIYELLDILSLISRSRLYLVAITHIDPTTKKPTGRFVPHFQYSACPKKYLDLPLFENKDNFNWAESMGYLNKIAYEFNQEFHNPLALSVQFYHAALKFVGVDNELAYILLVSSIEAFLKDYPLMRRDDYADFTQVIKMIDECDFFNDTEKAELKNHYNHRKIGRKFIRFVEKYSKGFIKGGNYSKRFRMKLKRSDLFNLSKGKLKSIYKARSDFLHEGMPMYLLETSEIASKENWDIAPSQGMVIGRKRFTEKEKLPYLHFFEGLVRHCILKYIEGNSSS